jgi:Spy/CpxP family protein refolding chaperone
MNINAKAFLTTTAVLAALAGVPTLYAYADSSKSAAPGNQGGMMGDMGGMSQMMSQMTEMMDSCNAMMKTAAQHDHPETPTDGDQQ